MGWLTRLIDRIDAKLDRPADQTLLDDPGGGSERIIDSDTPEETARSVRNSRGRRSTRERWLGR
jgi:hypothetical protein